MLEKGDKGPKTAENMGAMGRPCLSCTDGPPLPELHIERGTEPLFPKPETAHFLKLNPKLGFVVIDAEP